MTRPPPLPLSRGAFKKRRLSKNGGGDLGRSGRGNRNNQECFANASIFAIPTLTSLDVLSRLQRPACTDAAARMRMPLLGTVVEEILDKRKVQSPGHVQQQRQQQQQRQNAISAPITMSASASSSMSSNTDHVASKQKIIHVGKPPGEGDMVHAIKHQKPNRKRRRQQQRAKVADPGRMDLSGEAIKVQSDETLPTAPCTLFVSFIDAPACRSAMEEEEAPSAIQQTSPSAGPEIIEIDDSDEDDDVDQNDMVASTMTRGCNRDGEDEVLLVYPFTKNVREMDRACVSLTELGDKTFHSGLKDNNETAAVCSCTANDEEVVFRDSFRVTVKDYRLLQPDQYWNDILIDFWMRWISRNEIEDSNDGVFFFTTQFYSELTSRSPEAMTRWIKRKGINIFQKRLLFLPIYADLHWTLAVIVNPGHILSMVATTGNDNDRTTTTRSTPFPCILFFDSLKKASRGTEHDPSTVAKNIRNLLNFEWSRLGRAAESKCVDPFTERCMLLVTPKVPQQKNGFDCGGFVCRAAYGIYRLRHHAFCFKEANYDERNGGSTTKKLFKSFLAEKPGLVRNKKVGDLNATGAAQRIRKEMMKLIQNLSAIYHQRKKRRNEHKLLMLEKHDAGASNGIKNNESVTDDIFHSKHSLNEVPRAHPATSQAEGFHPSASGQPEKLEAQRASRMDVGIERQQKKKKKKKKSSHLRDNFNEAQKPFAKSDKRRHTNGHLNQHEHPKKKKRFS